MGVSCGGGCLCVNKPGNPCGTPIGAAPDKGDTSDAGIGSEGRRRGQLHSVRLWYGKRLWGWEQVRWFYNSEC